MHTWHVSNLGTVNDRPLGLLTQQSLADIIVKLPLQSVVVLHCTGESPVPMEKDNVLIHAFQLQKYVVELYITGRDTVEMIKSSSEFDINRCKGLVPDYNCIKCSDYKPSIHEVICIAGGSSV